MLWKTVNFIFTFHAQPFVLFLGWWLYSNHVFHANFHPLTTFFFAEWRKQMFINWGGFRKGIISLKIHATWLELKFWPNQCNFNSFYCIKKIIDVHFRINLQCLDDIPHSFCIEFGNSSINLLLCCISSPTKKKLHVLKISMFVYGVSMCELCTQKVQYLF